MHCLCVFCAFSVWVSYDFLLITQLAHTHVRTRALERARANAGTCCGSDPKVGIPTWFAAGGTGIDTALDYKDQQVIAQILATEQKPRSAYFMTTKIVSNHHYLYGSRGKYAFVCVRLRAILMFTVPSLTKIPQYILLWPLLRPLSNPKLRHL